MSVVWIKVDRENKTHSAYSDGIELKGDYIAGNSAVKIIQYEFLRTSILLGIVGSTHGSAYIKKYFPIKWETSNIQYWKEEAIMDLSEFFENMANEYEQKYNEPLKNDVILSINGTLFWAGEASDGKIWQVVRTDDNFICAGTPCSETRALLYYNENIEPQDLLNTIAKIQIATNTKLSKIENIKYE